MILVPYKTTSEHILNETIVKMTDNTKTENVATANDSAPFEDLCASRITLLVPPGTDSAKAEQFAISYGGKVVFCKPKEIEETSPPPKEEKPASRGWFSWLWPSWGSSSTKSKEKATEEPANEDDKEKPSEEVTDEDKTEQNDDESSEEQPPPPPESDELPTEEQVEEDNAEPELLTPEQLMVITWVERLGCSPDDAKTEWDLMTDSEKVFMEVMTDRRNENTIKKFMKEHPNAAWTLAKKIEENGE